MDVQKAILKAKSLVLAWLFLSLLLPATGQLIDVTSRVSRDSLMIGEQVTYTLKVDADPDLDFLLPRIRDTLNSQLEVLGQLRADTLMEGERVLVEHSYLITGFESGDQIIPSQKVLYRRNEKVDTAKSMPLILHIYDPEVDMDQEIKPIKPPINTPLTFMEVLPWAALGLGGALISASLIWLVIRYVKRRNHPEIFTQKPLEPAHVIAFRELDKLREEKLWARGEVKQYYTRLTEITRQYIERQYGIPAMESTTEEILDAFGRTNAEDQLLDEILKELLELADLVKFAREDPLPVDNQSNLNNAYIFIQKTYPQFYRTEEQKEGRDA